MSERLEYRGPENRSEKNAELSKEAEKQHERLNDNLEAQRERAEKANKSELESARHEALEKARKTETEKPAEKANKAETQKDRLSHLSRKKREAVAFDMEMNEARKHMSGSSKAFSKVIHNKAVEKTSEAVGATVARPNAMLSGAIFAFVITGALYIWARWAGYPLSGFETIGSFIIGWLLGVIFDYTRIMVTGKR